MSATPTVIPRPLIFPRLLPELKNPYPTPLPNGSRHYGHMNSRRNLEREMDDLSDEENEVEDITRALNERGYNFLVPMGRSTTQQEEKNDLEEDDDSQSGQSEAPAADLSSVAEDNAEPSEDEDDGPDLDADMEDEDGGASSERADEEGEESDEEDDMNTSMQEV